MWDIPARKRLFQGKTRGAHMMAFSPDGKFFAVGGNYSEFHIHDAATGKLYWDLTLKGHGDTALMHVEFTPDSRFLVSSSINGMLRVWDVKEKQAQALFLFPSNDPADRGQQKEFLRAWLALAGPKRLPDDVKVFVDFKEEVGFLHQFALSPDGKIVAVPTTAKNVLVVELATGKLLASLKTQDKTYGVCFSPDGKRLAVGGGEGTGAGWRGSIEIWDVAKRKRSRQWDVKKHSALKMAFSPDGKILATGGTTDGVRVWEAATGKLM
ncbi:MAG: WD40 repeat domain-containing protein [Gemmataceae bacterium]|nr:WD40 repeat domain-containing protein [Gemmataceae bacterium]